MNVLVTGLGLIGSWVVKHLITQGHTPTIFDVAAPSPWSRDVLESVERVPFVQGDITDLPDLLDAIKRSRAEAVIHTAGLLTQAVRQRPYAGIRINFLGSVNVLEAMRILGGGRVVFCSSSTVYTGVWEKYPGSVVPADFAMNVVRDRPRSVYATAKLAMEWLGLNYHDAQYVDFVAVRFQGVIGPWAGPLNAIPPRILKAIVEPAVRGEHVRIDDPMIVWKGVEEFVHASDAALGATLAASAPDVQDRVYSIGMGRAYSLAEIVDIARALFPGVRIEVAITPTGGIAGYPAVRHQACDAGAAQRDLGFVPQFDMRAAMEDYAGWYRQHPATGRR